MKGHSLKLINLGPALQPSGINKDCSEDNGNDRR